MGRLLAVLVLAGASANAQTWVESYTYTGSSLDSQKWTITSNIGPVPYIFLNPGLRLSAESNVGNQSGGSFSSSIAMEWYFRPPTNADWSVVQRFKVNNSQGWMNAFIGANDGFGEIFLSFENQYVSGVFGGNITSLSTGSAYSYYPISENGDYHWFGLAYSSSSRTLSQIFSFDSDENIPSQEKFTKLSESAVLSNEIKITTAADFLWGYPTGLFHPGDNITYTDFQIVPYTIPEPSSLSLLVLGGVVVALRRRKKY
jgi:hypothetical protein